MSRRALALEPVTIGRVTFQHPLMNGAGVCKFLDQVQPLLESAASAVNIGSITPLARPGNTGDVYYNVPNQYALNSYGMPNAGAERLSVDLADLMQKAEGREKTVVINIAGFGIDDYLRLAQVCHDCRVDMIELNFGCPNVWQGGKSGADQKRITTFDIKQLEQTLTQVTSVAPSIVIAAKLSIISDPFYRAEVAAMLTDVGVDAVTLINTFPNAFLFNEDGKQAISNVVGLAGMSGPALKPIGLGHVREFRDLLPESTLIIGVGGVTTGLDLLDYLDAGADLVQVTTAVINEGPQALSRILAEYVALIDDSTT